MITYTNISTGQVVESETEIPRLEYLSAHWARAGEAVAAPVEETTPDPDDTPPPVEETDPPAEDTPPVVEEPPVLTKPKPRTKAAPKPDADA